MEKFTLANISTQYFVLGLQLFNFQQPFVFSVKNEWLPAASRLQMFMKQRTICLKYNSRNVSDRDNTLVFENYEQL
jgi:hypothetical protein